MFFRTKNEVSYITETVKRGTIKKVVNATGEVGASNLVSVGAQVSGQIEKLYVDVGDVVKKGDMIAQIDSTTQQNDLDINKAKLQSYKAQLESAKIALKVAKSQYDRASKLSKGNAISKESFEDIENTYAAAKSKVTEAESLVKQTQISVKTAETNMGYTKITAPIDGTIVSVPVKEGQTVNSNQTTPTIVQVADLSKMEILMEISEGDVTKVKPGMKVAYTVLSESNEVYEATLKSIDPGLTTLTNGTYTGVVDSSEAVYYYGRLLVDNPDGKLRIGMTTQDVITVETADNVISISNLAITTRGTGKYVKVLTDKGIVEEREIVTGISDNMNIEVIKGLAEGDKVILAEMTSEEIAKISSVNGPGRRF